MTKVQFVRRAAANQGNTVAETRYWVDLILEELKKAVIEEEFVDLRGFGRFSHVHRKGFTRLTPQGEKQYQPPFDQIRFALSPYIRTAVALGLTYPQYCKNMEVFRAYRKGEEVPGLKGVQSTGLLMWDDEALAAAIDEEAKEAQESAEEDESTELASGEDALT